MKSCAGVNKAVSKSTYNFVSEDRIEKMKQVRLKKTSESKVDWAVTAYIDWRNEYLDKFQYDPAIHYADLLSLDALEKENLNHSLCR